MKLEPSALYSFYGNTSDRTIYASRGTTDWRFGFVAESPDSSPRIRTDCPEDILRSEHPYSCEYSEPRSFPLWYRKAGDVLWGVDACLVTEKVAEAPAPYRFAGMEFRPVNLYSDREYTKPMAGSVELRVIGRVPVNLGAPGVDVKSRCPRCGATAYKGWKQARGLHFEGSNFHWPDIFMTAQEITNSIFVKPHFAQLLADMRICPVTLTRIEDIELLEWDDDDVGV